jgi:antitoxin component YwqK of YwqJK toxin-antitoxin module
MFSIVMNKKALNGNTVFLLKNGTFEAIKHFENHDQIKTWKTLEGAQKKWNQLCAIQSAYKTETKVIYQFNKPLNQTCHS